MGIPVVDDHRQTGFPGQVQLADQKFLLLVMGRVFIVVVIQADFPDGHHPRIGAPGFNLFQVFQGAVADFFRMESLLPPTRRDTDGPDPKPFGSWEYHSRDR